MNYQFEIHRTQLGDWSAAIQEFIDRGSLRMSERTTRLQVNKVVNSASTCQNHSAAKKQNSRRLKPLSTKRDAFLARSSCLVESSSFDNCQPHCSLRSRTW